MIVDPYIRFPLPPTVALLTADGDGFVILDERGRLYRDPSELEPEHRVWGSYDLVHDLVARGVGEALCWNNEEVRWRHVQQDRSGWTVRPSDVAVLKLPFPDNPRETLRGLGLWRDWLASYGASPTGTSGSAAWSLLRARLTERLWTTQPTAQLPPIRWTLGGRQQLGVHGPGRFQGTVEQWDLPAAYASLLGSLSYGGHWSTGDRLAKRPLDPAFWGADERPVFVRCKIRVPDSLPFGPLPRRPRRRVTGPAAVFLGADYPTGCRLQGCWTWQELQAAIDAGCTLEKVLQVFVHFAPGRPFLPWWQAVEKGRSMPGLAGLLAKVTGNALWGRFCMDPGNGERTIRSRVDGQMTARPVVSKGGVPAAHDLAETVSGRVRARLFRAMSSAGDTLLSAHTDGVWLQPRGPIAPKGWRRKARARRLDLLDPQVLRYWPQRAHPAEPFHVFAGLPAEQAPRLFEELWREAGFPATFEFGRTSAGVAA